MFTVQKITRRKGSIITITNDEKAISLIIDDLAELTQLHEVISEYLASQKVGDFIGSTQAQAIAIEQGYNIPITTLVNACARGTLLAHKKKGRWYIARTSFDTWFEEWKAKQDLQD